MITYDNLKLGDIYTLICPDVFFIYIFYRKNPLNCWQKMAVFVLTNHYTICQELEINVYFCITVSFIMIIYHCFLVQYTLQSTVGWGESQLFVEFRKWSALL